MSLAALACSNDANKTWEDSRRNLCLRLSLITFEILKQFLDVASCHLLAQIGPDNQASGALFVVVAGSDKNFHGFTFEENALSLFQNMFAIVLAFQGQFHCTFSH